MMDDRKTEEERSYLSQRSIVFNHDDDEQVAVIRKELVILTGDFFSAVILDQLLYLTLQAKDFELFAAEEKRASLEAYSFCCHGWLSKSTQELLEETMLGVTVPTLRRYLNGLVKQGWVRTRRNVQNKVTRTIQYRVNLNKVRCDLQGHGYSFPGLEIYGRLPSLRQISPESSKYLKVSFASDGENGFLRGRSL
jgi:hypothetical protein